MAAKMPKYTTHYPGRQWAKDMNLWAEEVRKNIRQLEKRISKLEDPKGELKEYQHKAFKWPEQ